VQAVAATQHKASTATDINVHLTPIALMVGAQRLEVCAALIIMVCQHTILHTFSALLHDAQVEEAAFQAHTATHLPINAKTALVHLLDHALHQLQLILQRTQPQEARQQARLALTAHLDPTVMERHAHTILTASQGFARVPVAHTTNTEAPFTTVRILSVLGQSARAAVLASLEIHALMESVLHHLVLVLVLVQVQARV
jgi:hypothetical protein